MPAGLPPFAEVSINRDSFGGRTSALLIVKQGRIVSEWYQPGHDLHTAQRTFSVAKSMAATLIGHAVLKGQIDVAKPATIAEWQTPGDPRAAITTEQLMRMASGLTSDTAGNRTDAIYMGGASVRQWTTQWPLLNAPNTRYRYANNDTMLAILSLKAAQAKAGAALDPGAFFDRLGMTRTFVERDKDGDYILSSQVWTTARDLARLGLLYQNDGMWKGERLLPENWRTFVTTPSGPQPDRDFGYGAGFWLLSKSDGIPADAFGAFGNRGQYLVIVPSRQLVIVRQGYDDDKNRLDIATLVKAVVAADERALSLIRRAVTLEGRKAVQLCHPADPFGGLDLRLRRDQVGIVERRDLHVDLAREDGVVGIEKPGPAIAAEMAAAMFRRGVDFGGAVDVDRILPDERPADHRRARMAAAISCNGTARDARPPSTSNNGSRRNGIGRWRGVLARSFLSPRGIGMRT